MTDILERLRGLAATCGCGACEDAGKEIERLRAALKKIADPDISWGHMKLIARETVTPHQGSKP